MKKIIFLFAFIFFYFESVLAETKVKALLEGNIDAKISIIVYESLTCGHCADFHKEVYPKLKKDFIDTSLVKIEFRNFPLDLAALNASKIAHCKNDGKADILHFLFENQKQWAQGDKIEDSNSKTKNILDSSKFKLDIDRCIKNKKVEDYILEDRIEAVKKFKLNATPNLIINDKKFDKSLNYKIIKKTLEKMI